MQFDWDDGNTTKCLKHGLSRKLIEDFFRSRPRVAPDFEHSDDEQRFIAIGRIEGRPIFVAFCWRRAKIRPVSARYMHMKEAVRYETHPNPEQ
jgi:uncharacterized protein